MGVKRLRCKNCGDEIESEHRHDFTGCSCGNIAVDGGDAYFRFLGDPHDAWDLTENQELTDFYN